MARRVVLAIAAVVIAMTGVLPEPAQAQAAQPDVYGRGFQGGEVGDIQARLKSLGYDPGPINGEVGLRTCARKIQMEGAEKRAMGYLR